MGTLYLVRHGQASFGEDDYDKLSELGHRQSRRLGEYFAAKGLHFELRTEGRVPPFVRADAPGDRLATVAGRLRDVANASVARRRELLDEFLRFRRADLVKRLQAQFALAGDKAPVWWQADVRELITANGKALTQRTSLRLGGWPTDLDDDAAAQRLAQELRAFAGVLEAWPALWQAAAQAGDGLLEGA